ncbi:MAG: hypothetical protein EAZ92_14845 [Candidatus Kapaibacterium sp.]|nr:MAG: hypothetical protein EAZ92_14845 [Candidatus Kapabacteria bacterium]
MKYFLAHLFALLLISITAQGTVLAQTVRLDENIITFDKLSKTIIPFTADKKPSVSIKQSLEGRYSLVFNNGKGTLTFDKPVSAGTYTITLSDGGKTASAKWKVLPTTLPTQSMRKISSVKLYYGKQISLSSNLPEETELPAEQFKIEYQFGNEQPNLNNPYNNIWRSPYIPASARKVRFGVVWIYPPTGERVELFSKNVTPDQTPPDIVCNRSIGELRSSSSMLNTASQPIDFQIAVKGIGVDYEVPIDADNSNPQVSKSIKATLSDVESNAPADIDYSSNNTKLIIYNGDEPDPTAAWTANRTNFYIEQGEFDVSTGTFPITITVKNLPRIPPQQTRILRGTVAFKVNAKILNRTAGIYSELQRESCVVSINILYQSPEVNFEKQLNISKSKSVVFTAATTASAQTTQENTGEPTIEEKAAAERVRDSLYRVRTLTPKILEVMAKYPSWRVWRITSPTLREEVQVYLIRIGRNVPTTPLGAEIPLILHGIPKKNGKFEITSLRFGNELLTKREIDDTMLSFLSDILSAPFDVEGGSAYQHEWFSVQEMEKEQELIYSLADKAGYYQAKATLRRLGYYRHSGYALYEADSALVRRLKETFTPNIPRTPGLEAAEKACTNSEEINKRIRKRQPVPQSMIDEGGSPTDCEVVKNYYIQLASLVQIGKAFILVNMRTGEPNIIGVVSIEAASSRYAEADPDFLLNALYGPIKSGILDVAELRQFKTKEFEKDEVTKALVAVRGSMLTTNAENLYDYCMEGLRKGIFIDRTASVMAFPASVGGEKRK